LAIVAKDDAPATNVFDDCAAVAGLVPVSTLNDSEMSDLMTPTADDE